jgi:hypothetical protein
VEFACNNRYQGSLKIIQFEYLYGRKCNTPVSWDNLENIAVLGLELLKDMEVAMVRVKKNLKAASDKQKNYEDKNMTTREFKVEEHVLLKFNSKKRSLKLVSCTLIISKLCGPFQILDRIGPIACMFALPTSMNLYNVFHVSLLNKYVHDPNHVIDWHLIQVEAEEGFQVHPM